MEEIELNAEQLRFYQEIYEYSAEIEKGSEQGPKVAAIKAFHIFRSADLSDEAINKITLLAGVPHTALYLSKKQFFACLKLISAYQAKIPLREELITTNLVSLPLPRFHLKGSSHNTNKQIDQNCIEKKQWIEVHGSELLHIVSKQDEITDNVANDQTGTDSEIDTRDIKSKVSPEAWSTASDSPTPTNSVVPGERPWAKTTNWLCEEQRGLLGTEEESSDRHSSDEEHEIDLETIYQITQEQRDYYIKQFQSIKPDKGFLPGLLAKTFFEKSRIPVDELCQIWQLCSINLDIGLSQNQFILVMHLVVLYRNNIPIPVVLPSCLGQIIEPEQKQDAPEGDLLHLEEVDENNLLKNNDIKENNKHKPNLVKPTSPKMQIPRPSSEGSPEHSIGNDKKEWTKFPESPTSSNLSSPGPKPVNFISDFASNGTIVHPIALRVTPEKATDDDILRRSNNSPGKLQGVVIVNADIRSIQRPQPKKMSSKGSIPPPPQREPSLTHADSVDASYNCKKDLPPAPPPRIQRGHHRSSSLDLKKLKMDTEAQGPHLQPMSSYDGYGCVEPSAFADFAQFSEGIEEQKNTTSNDLVVTTKVDVSKNTEITVPKPFPRSTLTTNSLVANRSSAFEVYRKPSTSRNSQSPNTISPIIASATTQNLSTNIERFEKRVIAISENLRLIRIQPGETMADILKHVKEQNLLLLKLCNDLSEELLEVQSRKEDLRIKLEMAINQKNG